VIVNLCSTKKSNSLDLSIKLFTNLLLLGTNNTKIYGTRRFVFRKTMINLLRKRKWKMKKRNKQPVHAARGYHSETGCCGSIEVYQKKKSGNRTRNLSHDWGYLPGRDFLECSPLHDLAHWGKSTWSRQKKNFTSKLNNDNNKK
jgi:hypothetical protein